MFCFVLPASHGLSAMTPKAYRSSVPKVVILRLEVDSGSLIN